MIWWANRQARVERERACDEEVLANLGCPATDYARMLVEILAWRNQLPTALSWPAMRSRDVTKRRLDHILRRPGTFRRRASWAAWAIVLLLAAVALPGAALQLTAEAETENTDRILVQPVDSSQPVAIAAPNLANREANDERLRTINAWKRLGLIVKQGASGPVPWTPFTQLTLPPSWVPTDELALKNVTDLQSISVGAMPPEAPPDEERLRAQLLALKLLPASAMLNVQYTADNVGALEVLKQLPALEQLAVGPFVDNTKLNQATRALPAAFGLETLTKLRTLSIAAAPADMTRIAALTNLTNLSVSGEFPGAELDELASLIKLTVFSLDCGPAEENATISLACLDGMTKLETLFCGDKCRIDDTAAQHIGSNPSLRILTLYFDHLTDAGLRQLARGKELRWLSAISSANTGEITSAGLARLGEFKKLQVLQFHAWALPGQTPLSITDEAVAGWASLKDLRSLRVQPCQLSDAALRTIGQLSRLEALELIGDNSVTDAGMQPLSALSNLRAFVMHTSRLNGPGLAALRGLSHLQLLAVPDAPIDDRGLNIIAGMSGLKALDLAHTAITDAGLRALRDKLPELAQIDLAGTKVTDQGLDVLLDRAKLQQIYAIDTGMSIALLKKLIASDEQMCVWVLDPERAQNQRNRFYARWQPINVDTLRELTARLWQLTSAAETQQEDAESNKQSSNIDGTAQPRGTVTTVFALNAADPAGNVPEPTAEQQDAMAELKKLGFPVTTYVDDQGKLKFSGRFAKDFKPTESPLPLEKLPALGQLSLFPWDGIDLATRLRALRNLQPGTTLHIELRATEGEAFNLLAEMPGLMHLMLTGELPPLEPADSPTGRTVRIDRLSNLQFLLCQLSGSKEIVNELVGLEKITELNLAGSSTKMSLAPLAKLVTLERLSLLLGEQKNSPPRGLQWLAQLVKLRRLMVSLPVTDAAMQRIGELQNLRRLLVEVGHVTDAGLTNIEKLSQLETLNLYDNSRPTQITTNGLQGIGTLTNLKSLWFGSYRQSEQFLVNDTVLESWSGLTNLRVLMVSRCDLTPRGASTLANFQQLRSLQLHGTTGITDEMPALGPQMRELSLRVPELTDRGLAKIGKLTKLKFLSLYDAQRINDAGLKTLEPLAALQSLALSGATLHDSGTRALTQLPRLTELSMFDCKLSDDAVAALGQLKHVTTLNLSHNGLTDSQVKLLASLTKLRDLDLSNNPITDAALPPLDNLKQLRTFWLDDTKTTAAGRAQLAKELPNATIDTNKWRLSMFRANDQFLDD